MKRTLLFFSLTIIIGLIFILIFPYYSINPGVLVKGHSNLQNDCFACHSIGSGAPTEKCIACHNLANIGKVNVEGLSLTGQNSKTNLLHKSITDIRCFDCHTEHNGLSKENATLNFAHSVLPKQMLSSCADCHSDKKPDNKVHNYVSSDCFNCHTVEEWNLAEFKHQLLGSNQNDCRSCHSNKIPNDGLHKGLGISIQCIQCHNTNEWKPSTFEHTKYFRFDNNHPADCTKCHNTKDNFKFYSCYNCHEHQPSQISKKHLEEGIKDFINCVKCHRSGDEDEATGKGNENNKNREHGNDED